MTDHEQAAQQAEEQADQLEQERDRLEQHIDDAKQAKDDAYKDPVIAEPLDGDAAGTED